MNASEKAEDIRMTLELRVSDDDGSYLQIYMRMSNLFLAFDAVNQIFTLQETATEYSLWILHPTNLNEFFLQHKESRKFLRCSIISETNDGVVSETLNISLTQDQGRATIISLDPSTPTSNKHYLRSSLIIGGASALFAPYIVSGVVGALGFTSSGIAAGSLGAKMMSFSAAASGGEYPPAV